MRSFSWRRDLTETADLIGGAAPPSTIHNPWGYASGHTDANGLIKFGARYYNPNQARWTRQDPQTGRSSNTLTTNGYIYAGNDPLDNADIAGTSYWPVEAFGIALAGIYGAAVFALGLGGFGLALGVGELLGLGADEFSAFAVAGFIASGISVGLGDAIGLLAYALWHACAGAVIRNRRRALSDSSSEEAAQRKRLTKAWARFAMFFFIPVAVVALIMAIAAPSTTPIALGVIAGLVIILAIAVPLDQISARDEIVLRVERGTAPRQATEAGPAPGLLQLRLTVVVTGHAAVLA